MGEDQGKVPVDLTESETIAPGSKSENQKQSQPEFPVADWDKYQFISYIGEGGMGRVYKAVDKKLNRFVALKFIRGEDPELKQRFIREARAQASVDHQNVCEIFEAGEVEGKLYIAMQFIEGKTLTRLPQDITLAQKVRIMKEVAEGLHAAHKLGLIHRDIKPGNIMVERQDDGSYRPYIMDFGLVREIQSEGMTLTGTALIGTPEFMAPEQAMGISKKMDRRVDIYGLGATFYTLLTGHPPFSSNSTLALLKQVVEEEPKSLSKLAHNIPIDLETIVMKCLEKEPERRYDTARDLADDLQRFLDGEPVYARRPTITYKLAKKARKNKLLVAVISIATIAILTLAGYGIRVELQARQKAAIARQFGQQVERMDAIMRISHTIPLHDTRAEKKMVEQSIEELRKQMKTLGAASSGPGHYAIGRGFLSLNNYEMARTHLEQAWKDGYQDAENAYALGLVYGKLYQKELEAIENIRNKDAREARRTEIEKLYRIPAVNYLKLSKNAQTAAPEYVEGLIHYYEKRFEAALVKTADAIRRIPWLYEARILEGHIFMSIGNDHRAAGKTAEAMDAYRKVEAALTAAARIGESDVESYAGLCTLWTNIMYTQIYSSGEEIGTALQKAEAACNQALQADPERGNVHTKLANAYWLWAEYQRQHGENAQGALQQSITFAEKAIQLDPNDALAHKNMGTAYQMLGGNAEKLSQDPSPYLDKAIQSYDKALKANPRDFTVYNSLGNTYAIRGDFERKRGNDPSVHYNKAIQTFLQGIEINPKFPYIYSNLGVTYVDLGNYRYSHGKLAEGDKALEQGIKNYETTIKLKSDDVYAYNNLGNALKTRADQEWKRGKNPDQTALKAEAVLQKAMQINPDYHTPYSNLGEIYRIQAAYRMENGGDPSSLLEKAIGLYEKGFSINSSDFGYPLDIAVVRMMMFKHDPVKNANSLSDAAESLKKAADLGASGSSYYFQRLGELKTLEALQKIRQNQPSDAEFRAAKAAFEQSIQGNPNNAYAFRSLAECYSSEAKTRKGEEAQALVLKGIEAAEKALSINPGLKDASKIRASLIAMHR